MTDASTWHRGTWITAKHAGRCARCDAETFRGQTVLWLPRHKRLLCGACGNGRNHLATTGER